MGVKDNQRMIHFSDADIDKLEDLAKEKGERIEDYVANMIHSKLIPLLEKQTEEVRTEIERWTDRDWNTFFIGGKVNITDHSVENYHRINHRNWLNGHTNHFFPLVMSLRVLLSLSRKRNQPYVQYDEFISEAFDVGLKFKHHLIEVEKGEDGLFERGLTNGLPWCAYELELSHRGGTSRRTNTPIAYREKRSKEKFHQYYTSVKPESIYPGVLVLLGLVDLDAESGSAWRISDRSVALTKRGYELAMSGDNPLLDSLPDMPAAEIKSALSAQEQNMIMGAITKHCPIEAKRMRDVLGILEVNDTSTQDSRHWGLGRSSIFEEIRENKLESFEETRSDQTLNKELSSLLSRMQDLGLILQGAGYVSGSRKSFSCTPEGSGWL